MNITTRILLVACMALAFAACKKEQAPAEEAAQAPLTVPADNDDAAWKAYLADVVQRNMGNIASSPYLYYLPPTTDPEFDAKYERMLDKARTDIARGIVEGNMLAFGSSASAKMADLVVASFEGVPPNTMKGVKVLFIGQAADNERVKAAVAPAGVDYTFVEAK